MRADDAETPVELLAVARVVAAHGVQGEVRCEVLTDFPDRFRTTREVIGGPARTVMPVQRARLVKDGVLLKLVGVDSRTDAERLRGMVLYVSEADAVPLPPDTYFWHQIIGLEVRTHAGDSLGRIVDILQTGSNDVYVVRDEGREVLIPAIRDVVTRIDLAAGIMVVDPIDGLV